ncbi:hypothetical protein SEA_DATBOI_19 [Gordonia phage DatBoi]|nr:hypothetical protein SEA_DATBOI_19 [Gordonia phage DatBoi]
MARLRTFVHTKDPKGRAVLLTPDTDPLPVWATAAIRNPKVWDEPPVEFATGGVVPEPAAVEPVVEPVAEAPAEPVAEPVAEAPVAAEQPAAEADDDRPAESASKADWVAYATGRELDVKGLTKPAIIALVDELDREVED